MLVPLTFGLAFQYQIVFLKNGQKQLQIKYYIKANNISGVWQHILHILPTKVLTAWKKKTAYLLKNGGSGKKMLTEWAKSR